MGLLDWLTDLGGSDQMGALTAGGGAGSTMPGFVPQTTQAMPPVQPTGEILQPPLQPPDGGMQPRQAPPLAPPDGAAVPTPPSVDRPMPPVQTLDNQGPSPVQDMGSAPPLPPGQQGVSSDSRNNVPLPVPRPAAANAPPIPPNAQPTQGTLPAGQPANGALDAGAAVRSYQGAGGSLTPPPQAAQPQQGFSLSHALGLNISDAQRGALAAGLKSVGENSTKPGLAAFSGSLGSGMEGAKATTDKTFDQKIKYLQAAVSAQQAGDKAEYNRNYAAYLSGKLKNEQDTAAGKGDGKSKAWNKPDSQKFIDAQHALAADPEIKASQKLLEQTARTGEPAEIAKAQAAHSALIQQKQGMYLTGVGLDPRKAMAQAQNPPGTPPQMKNGQPVPGTGNPHIVTSKEDFDQYVKPGDAYINPRDNKVYIRKGGSQSGGAESPAGGGSAPAPSSPPAPPGPAPGIKTEDDD